MTRYVRIAACLTCLSAAGPAFGDMLCEELWLTRNTVFDRAGHCFSSALGQAVFDNTGCTGTDVTLSPSDQEVVASVQEMEGLFQCDVDTSATALDPWVAELIPIYDRLERLPVRADGESGCLGYLGDPLALHAAPGADSDTIGMLMTGQDIGYAHIPVEGWDFVFVLDHDNPGQLVSWGWMVSPPMIPEMCEGFAG